MTSYNLDLLNKLLSHMKTLMGARISFYDTTKRSTDAHSLDKLEFCDYVKKTLRPECSKTDDKALRELPKNSNAYAYHCHFGLIEIAKKVIIGGELAGYFLIGPFREEEKDDEQLEKVFAYAEKNGFDSQELVDKYKLICSYSKEKFEAIDVVTDIFVDYVAKKDILVDKQDIFSRIEPYIKNNLDGDLSVETLGKHFFMTQKQLYRIFIAATGKSPKKYITEQRIKEAKRLLWLTDVPLTQVAEKVGIEDYNYFVKIFKAYENQTPFTIRKNSRITKTNNKDK